MAKEDARDFLAGAHMLADAIASMPQYLEDCHSMHDDMVEFEDWAKLFLKPKTATATIKSNLKTHLPALTLYLRKA